MNRAKISECIKSGILAAIAGLIVVGFISTTRDISLLGFVAAGIGAFAGGFFNRMRRGEGM